MQEHILATQHFCLVLARPLACRTESTAAAVSGNCRLQALFFSRIEEFPGIERLSFSIPIIH